jgi:hypothetical protein
VCDSLNSDEHVHDEHQQEQDEAKLLGAGDGHLQRPPSSGRPAKAGRHIFYGGVSL